MAVPTRTEALALLLALSPSRRLVQHVTVTAEVASFLAHRMASCGHPVDRRLAETAGLLHDLDKALPRDHPLLAAGHGHAGAAYLAQAGHPELVRAVADHPVMRLMAPDASEWVASAPLEQRIVAYADKRAMQRVVSLDQRFARWVQRHPGQTGHLAQARAMARRLEEELCGLAGITPGRVVRLRWVEDAARRAQAMATPTPTRPETGRASWSSARPPSGGAATPVAVRPAPR